MTQEPETTSGKVAKLNRVERNAWTKRKIFDAATRIVGKYGYAEASVARITEEAGVAQGTFYNHFENRQELLDLFQFAESKFDRESEAVAGHGARGDVPEFGNILQRKIDWQGGSEQFRNTLDRRRMTRMIGLSTPQQNVGVGEDAHLPRSP